MDDWETRLGSDCVRISLITRANGVEVVPFRSGLNWGQRQGRDPNQAYLPIPAADQRRGFFPEAGVQFSVVCDDATTLLLVRAQQNGKALQTPDDNAKLGIYFRRRLGVRLGDPISIRHLIEYGRTSIYIFRTSDGQYLLDFRSIE